VPDLDLELALAGIGRELAYPPTPDLVSAVGRRLEAAARPRPGRRRALVLAFAILVATAGIAAAVTGGFHGLRLVFVDRIPPVRPDRSLALGLQVKHDEARRLAGFTLITPGPPLRAPGAWFVESIDGGRVVTLVWGARKDLPPARHGVSVLATEAQGQIERGYATKFVGPDAKIVPITVNGAAGLWITGAPHAIAWSTGGDFAHQEIRLVGNVIVWNQGSLLLRIEGARTLAEARRLASSFADGRAEGTG
jgi:hypothetical protein